MTKKKTSKKSVTTTKKSPVIEQMESESYREFLARKFGVNKAAVKPVHCYTRRNEKGKRMEIPKTEGYDRETDQRIMGTLPTFVGLLNRYGAIVIYANGTDNVARADWLLFVLERMIDRGEDLTISIGEIPVGCDEREGMPKWTMDNHDGFLKLRPVLISTQSEVMYRQVRRDKDGRRSNRQEGQR